MVESGMTLKNLLFSQTALLTPGKSENNGNIAQLSFPSFISLICASKSVMMVLSLPRGVAHFVNN